jgi:long-subunit fatty acid transport protein
MRLGTAYKISSKVLFVAEAEKNVDYPLRGKVGIEYAVVSNFFIRGGFATQPVEVSFGVGYQFKKFFKVDLGSCYHQILGWSPNFSFNYQLQ